MKKLYSIFGLIAITVCCGIKPSDIIIRDYNPLKDYAGIIALCGKVWNELAEPDETCTGSLDVQLQIGLAYRQLRLEKKVEMLAKVVELDRNIIGFACLTFYNEAIDSVLPEDKGLVELSYFFFDPAYRGKGYSVLLLDSVKKELVKRNALTIITRIPATNDDALSWHQMQGFHMVYAGMTETPLEERERVQANSEGLALLRFRLGERARQSITPYQEYIDRFNTVDHQKKLSEKIQVKACERLANLAQISFPSLPFPFRFRLARWFLKLDNDELTLNAGLYILKKTTRDTMLVNTLTHYLAFLRKHYVDVSQVVVQEETEFLGEITAVY